MGLLLKHPFGPMDSLMDLADHAPTKSQHEIIPTQANEWEIQERWILSRDGAVTAIEQVRGYCRGKRDIRLPESSGVSRLRLIPAFHFSTSWSWDGKEASGLSFLLSWGKGETAGFQRLYLLTVFNFSFCIRLSVSGLFSLTTFSSHWAQRELTLATPPETFPLCADLKCSVVPIKSHSLTG